jgi:hypothetical protein
MDDHGINSVIYSRSNLKEVPSEIFKIATRIQLRVLDLSNNQLTTSEVAILGDEDEEHRKQVKAQMMSNAAAAAKAATSSRRYSSTSVTSMLGGHIAGNARTWHRPDLLRVIPPI